MVDYGAELFDVKGAVVSLLECGSILGKVVKHEGRRMITLSTLMTLVL